MTTTLRLPHWFRQAGDRCSPDLDA